jgi:hypothetical protein
MKSDRNPLVTEVDDVLQHFAGGFEDPVVVRRVEVVKVAREAGLPVRIAVEGSDHAALKPGELELGACVRVEAVAV